MDIRKEDICSHCNKTFQRKAISYLMREITPYSNNISQCSIAVLPHMETSYQYNSNMTHSHRYFCKYFSIYIVYHHVRSKVNPCSLPCSQKLYKMVLKKHTNNILEAINIPHAQSLDIINSYSYQNSSIDKTSAHVYMEKVYIWLIKVTHIVQPSPWPSYGERHDERLTSYLLSNAIVEGISIPIAQSFTSSGSIGYHRPGQFVYHNLVS